MTRGHARQMEDHADDAGPPLRPLPEPWFAIEDARRPGFVTELNLEAAEGHPLYGVRAVAVARCEGCDRVVFRVEAPPMTRWALVHLTWSRGTEPPPWPTTVTFDDAPPLLEALGRHQH